jgi:hypothetical protein
MALALIRGRSQEALASLSQLAGVINCLFPCTMILWFASSLRDNASGFERER